MALAYDDPEIAPGDPDDPSFEEIAALQQLARRYERISAKVLPDDHLGRFLKPLVRRYLCRGNFGLTSQISQSWIRAHAIVLHKCIRRFDRQASNPSRIASN